MVFKQKKRTNKTCIFDLEKEVINSIWGFWPLVSQVYFNSVFIYLTFFHKFTNYGVKWSDLLFKCC